MNKADMINKAFYIQYPLTYGRYRNYDIDKIIKFPLPNSGEMYDGWAKNTNHFTTEYHIKHSIPLLCDIFELPFNERNFLLDKRNSGKYDISILAPKEKYCYEVYGYNRNEHLDNLNFEEITKNVSIKSDITDYHKLYIYSHECSRLINKTIESDRKLFISGDSQMIPDVSFLSCFFKEVWYFDNRDKLRLSKEYLNNDFTDVLIELNHLDIKEYLETNFK